jgi:biopolymer transport protein ExbD
MHRRAIPFYTVPDQRPIADLNTTPLIDVMLVLLIMFIITVPVMTHKVAIDLPQPGARTESEPIIHHLALEADGGLYWNGESVRKTDLPARLVSMLQEPASQLHLSANGDARYEDYDELLAILKRGGVERLGFVGNAAFVQHLDR